MATEMVIRVLIILLISSLVWIIKYRKQQNSVQFLLVYCALVLFSGAVSWKAVDLLPVPTENVVVTALGEKNAEAKSDELYLTGVYANGEKVELKTATEDKWFWQKDWYVWRNSLNLNRPKDISDSFILKLPLGSNRYVEFFANKYKGIALVEYDNNKQTVDCYSPTDEVYRVNINDTSPIKILIYGVIQFALFTTIYFLILGVSAFLLMPPNGEQCLKVIFAKWDIIIPVFLSACTFCILLHVYPSTDHFYFDHITALGAALSEGFGGVWGFLMNNPPVPPLPLLTEYFYYKIVPIGYEWLFLLPTLCISLSVYLIERFVSQYSNNMIGLIAAVITMCSVTFIEHGKDIRHYSFSILATILLVFSYVNYRHEMSRKTIILFSCSMLLSAFCNYHSFILLLGIFFFDMALNCRHFSFKLLTPYLVAGTGFLPWAVIIFFRLMQSIVSVGNNSTWHQSLSIAFLRGAFYYVSGENIFLALLLIASFVVVVFWICRKDAISKDNFIYTLSIYLFIFFFVVVIIWALLNPKNTLLNNRYFSIIIPLASITQCVVFYQMTKITFSSNTIVQHTLPLMIFIIAFPHMMFSVIENQNLNPYGWLLFPDKITSHKEIYYQTSCVYTYVDVLRHKHYKEEKGRALKYLLQKDGTQYFINYSILTSKDLNKIKDYKKIYVIDLPEQEVNLIVKNGFTMDFRKGKLTIFSKA